MNAKELRKAALDLLSRREHTRQEISRKLSTKAEDASVLNDVLNSLQTERLQSDTRFVEAYVHIRFGKGYGPVRIKQELKERGVSVEEIFMALGAAEYDWFALAVQVKNRKFGETKTKEPKVKAQQMRFLQYRGFSSDHIKVSMEN